MKLIIILLVSITILQINGSKNDCHVFDNRCIFIDVLNELVGQSTAEANCDKYGGQLVTISSSAKNNFILDIISHSSHWTELWIGLKQNYISWKNSEGRTLTIDDYKNWEQNVSRRNYFIENHCTVIDAKSGLWRITNCHYTNYGICEINVIECRLSNIQIPHATLDKCAQTSVVKLGTQLSVTCNEGFIIHGPNYIYCTLGGWSQMPRCDPGCLQPDVDKNQVKIFNPKPEYAIGDKLLIYCEEGYLLNNKNIFRTHQIVQCNSSGKWSFLQKQCISHDVLQCDEDICTEVRVTAEETERVTLSCLLKEDAVNYSYFNWIKNHDQIELVGSNLIIPNFNSTFVGTYTCIRGHNSTNIQNMLIYNVELLKICVEETTTLHNLPTITATEGDSIYLTGSGTSSKINWFKDEDRLTIKKHTSFLPNGDILIKKITFKDQGLYKYEVENENTSCLDTFLLSVYVNVKAESICGMTDDENDQPWVVAFFSQDEISPFCYGTLVNEYWIISSAFCVSRYSRRKSAGVDVQFRDNSNTWFMPVNKFVVHPEYSRRLSINDFGLAKLKDPVTFSRIFKPICLSSRDFIMEQNNLCKVNSNNGLVAGWGPIEALTTSDIGPIRIENITTVSADVCQEFVSFEFPDKIFCTMFEHPHQSTIAVGDFGSPFLIQDTGRYYLQGVFSWGERVPHVGNYDYFTAVASYYDWIKYNMEL